MNSFNLIRNSLLAAILIMGAIWAYQHFSGNSSAINQEPVRPELKTYEEVRAYMQAKVQEPIPEDYQIPGYISAGLKIEQVYDSFAVRFPEFYGFGSTLLLDSIARHPLRYEKMLLENKAIRRYYDPNSKY